MYLIKKGGNQCIKKISLGTEKGLCLRFKNFALTSYKKLKLWYKKPSELFFVSIKSGCIYINDVEIINKRAKLQFAVFQVLIDQWIEDFLSGTQKYLTISEISLKLEGKGFVLDDFENQICKNIHHIRNSIRSIHKHLKKDSIVTSKKWKGYRLNDRVYLKRFY